jgi:hypothetical protein
MLVQKEKIGKKGKNDGVFTDDGFVIGSFACYLPSIN